MKKVLKIAGIVFAVLIVLGIIGNIIGGDDDNSASTASTTEMSQDTSSESTSAAEASQEASTEETEGETAKEPFEVTIDVIGISDGGKVRFEIETNLPDETELMLTLSRGDYNTDDSFTASTKTTVVGGKATSDPFSNKGEPLDGDFDLSVSMSLPSLQADAVRAVIGEQGEYITGSLVEASSIGSSNVVKAMFSVETGGEIRVSPTSGYTHTVFREESDEEEPVVEDNSNSGSDSQANKDYIEKYQSDIVVAASMALDRFIDKYDMSLAPQRWTLAKFDDQDAVIGMTDITVNNQKGKYIYVGTLNFDASGKVVSATPHYLEVNGQVLGNDGYCDDVFETIRALTGD